MTVRRGHTVKMLQNRHFPVKPVSERDEASVNSVYQAARGMKSTFKF